MMTNYYKIVLLMVAVVSLSGCRDMFYREVDFTVEGENEKIVVSSEYPIGESFSTRIYHSTLANQALSKGESGTGVGDADVRVRANSGAWQRMYSLSDKPFYYMKDSADQPVYFRPLDTVEMYVSHPRYPAVSVRQVLPGKTEGRVVRCYPMQEGWIALDIELDPYHGNPDDMIGIGILIGSALMANKSDTADKQTEILNLEYLYSTSADFAQAQNLQSEGYYAGSHEEFLFLPASALQDTLRLSLFADGWQLNNKREYINRNNYYPVGIQDLTLEVRAYTHDSYLYEVFRRNTTGVMLPPPSGVPTQDGNIVQEILEEIASALGGQEMIPPFTNVEGGLGCFRAYSYSYIIAEPSRVLPCTPSTTP